MRLLGTGRRALPGRRLRDRRGDDGGGRARLVGCRRRRLRRAAGRRAGARASTSSRAARTRFRSRTSRSTPRSRSGRTPTSATSGRPSPRSRASSAPVRRSSTSAAIPASSGRIRPSSHAQGTPTFHPGYRPSRRYDGSAPGVGDPDGLRARVDSRHLTLADFITAFAAAGLRIDRFEELERPRLSVPRRPAGAAMSVAASWADLLEGEELAHLEEVPARDAILAPLPDALHPRVREALEAQGIDALYAHQARGLGRGRARRALRRHHRHRLREDARLQPARARRARARAEAARALPLPDEGAGAGPGCARSARSGCPSCAPRSTTATRAAERRWQVRKWANLILTNPDMLHVGVLPHHDRWGDVLSNLALRRSSTRRTSTAACSARTSPTCCGGCGGSRASTAPSRSSCSPPRRSPTRASWRTRLLGVDADRDRRRRRPARRADGRALEPAADRRGARASAPVGARRGARS